MPAPGASEATQQQVLAALFTLHDDLVSLVAIQYLTPGWVLLDSGVILIPGGFESLHARRQAVKLIMQALTS